MMADWEKYDNKKKLAQELLALLKGEISNRKPVVKDKKNEQFVSVHAEKKRSNKRFTTPVLTIMYNNARSETVDWSLSGVKLRNWVDSRAKKNQYLTFTVGLNGKYVSAKGRLMWVNEKARESGIAFESLSTEAWEFFNKLQLMSTKIFRR